MLSTLLMFFRMLLTALGALALLGTLSWPDSILPPRPGLEDIPGSTLYDFKPWLWLLPLLWMELVSAIGPHRNRVWFTGLLGVLLAAFLAWPVLEARWPELVHPTFPYEDGKLAEGVGWLALISAVSLLFRLGLLAFLFPSPRPETSEENTLDAAVLDPSTARTVREIAADPIHVKPHFLFGDPDFGLIERFRMVMRRLFLRRVKGYLLLAFAALAALLWFFFYPRPNEQEALQRDLKAMYAFRTGPDGSLRATFPAVHAAWRVMHAIAEKESFAGLTREQAEQWLHLEEVPPAYRALLRDETDRPLASVDDAFESRTRFLTVSDGRRTAVLFIRTNLEGDVINIAEVQDAGWNDVMDLRRRIFGSDIDTRLLSR